MKELEQIQRKNNSRIIVRVNDFGIKNRDQNETKLKTEIECKMIIFDRKDNQKSSKNKYEQFSHSPSEIENTSTLNPKPGSLLDSTQKAQKTQAIKPKTIQKTNQKMNKSNTNIHEETSLNSHFCRSPRRYNVIKNESDENNDFVFY